MWSRAIVMDELVRQILQLKFDLEEAQRRIQRLENAVFLKDEIEDDE